MSKTIKTKTLLSFGKYKLNKYDILIISFIFLLGFFFFNYIKFFPSEKIETIEYKQYPLYGPHYYIYYTKAVMIWKYLTLLEFNSFFHYFTFPYINEPSTTIRALPLFLIFGPSEFVYFISGLCTNLILFFLIYLYLKKLFGSKESLLLTLLLITPLSIFALFVSAYIDLSIYFICTLFYLALKKFLGDYKKHNLELGFLIFAGLITKNIFYLIFPIFSVIPLSFVVISKDKHAIKIVKRFFLISFLAIGGMFLLYRKDYLNFVVTVPENILVNYSFINNVIIGLKNKLYQNSFLTTIAISSIIYSIIYKKNKYWISLVLASIIVFIPVVLVHRCFESRVMLPFLPVYIFLIFDFIYIISKKIFKGYWFIIILTTLIVIVILNGREMMNFKNLDLDTLTPNRDFELRDQYVNRNILYKLPQDSIIWIYSNKSCFIDGGYTSYDYEKEFFDLRIYGSRFKYKIVPHKIVNDVEKALANKEIDYILYSNCAMINSQDFQIINVYDVEFFNDETMNKIYLSKRKYDS